MRLSLPHPTALLVGCILLAAALTWVLPAGRYDRVEDSATGRDVVVAGSYRHVEPAPVGPFRAFVAIPRGFASAADVIALVFLVGGAFAVIEQTGALRRAVRGLTRRLAGREALLVPIACLAFAAGGATQNMQEEIIAFVPLLLLLVRSLGFDALVACAVSVGAAGVGAAFSPVNPFQVLIAQQLAQLPPGSGAAWRLAFLALALALWIAGVLVYARRHRAPPAPIPATDGEDRLGWRLDAILLLTAAAFVLLPVGLNLLGWGFDELSAMFFILGVSAGLLAGMGVNGTSEAFGEGFRQMTAAALLIGFAKTISVVLDEGLVLDTVVHGLVSPLGALGPDTAALAMMASHAALHVPVPSVSSQAVLTMPVLVPASDLLGISRQVTVLAYQYGAGITDLLTPTNGALMAILAAAGVRYDQWLRLAAPLAVGLFVLGAISVLLW